MVSKITEKGQALILIVLAAVGLFAFAALALDGSAVFSDRRHAQNAADTGAYAAALAKVRGKTEAEWKQAGLDRVESNGYKDDGVNEVWVYTCEEWKTAPENPDGSDCQGMPSGADPSEYIYVRIKSIVKMFFARVIGRQTITNYTDAVVHATPVKITEWFDGKAIVATKPDCPKPGDNYVPLVFGGNGATIVNNSGIFVNSSCDPAMKDNGTANTIKTTEGVCVYGGVPSGVDGFKSIDGSPLPPDDHCGTQVNITDYWMPDSDPTLLSPYCSSAGDITGSGGNYVATPGRFTGGAFPAKSPAGTLRLQKGVYCLDSGIDINSNWTITTDVNGDGDFDPDTEGVFLYVRSDGVTLNGGATVTLYPMKNTTGGFDSRLLDYLMFIPLSNEATVNISGNSATALSGEILAPSSHITLDGGGDTNSFGLNAQIIGYDTTITGNGTINITYDPAGLPPCIEQPKLSPTE